MTYLIIQIALFLLAATAIGWLIGRSLSKTRENVLIDEHQKLQGRHRTLEDFRDRMNKDYFTLKERERMKSSEISQLKKDLTDSRVKSETYQLEHYDMKLRLEKLAGQHGNVDNRLELERARFQKELESSQIKIKELMDRVGALASEKRTSDARITQLVNERQELTVRTQSHSDSVLDLNKKLHGLDHERENLQKETQELLNERIDLKNRISALVEDNNNLTNQVAELNLEKERSQAKVKHTGAELEDVTTQMINLRKQRDAYKNKLRTISSLVEPVKGQEAVRE